MMMMVAVKEVQLHNSHGFMRGIITNKSFTAEFYSDIGSRVYSTGNIEPRVF